MDLKTEVNNIVSRHVREGNMFSAYDITKELRLMHPNINIRHQDVRFHVTALFTTKTNPLFTRTTVTLYNGTPCEVYHPKNKNPIFYYASNTTTDIIECSKEGRITVPSKFIPQTVNFYKINTDNDITSITFNSRHDCGDAKTPIVESDGYTRIRFKTNEDVVVLHSTKDALIVVPLSKFVP